MQIYKVKSLQTDQDFTHAIQLIKDKTIWVSAPEKLNDTKEFRFTVDSICSEKTAFLLKQFCMKKGRSETEATMMAISTIKTGHMKENIDNIKEEIIEKWRSKFGITSFTEKLPCTEIWKEYGGNGNGIAVEYEMPSEAIDNLFHRVTYSKKHVIHIDELLEEWIHPTGSVYRKLLCTKESRWSHEAELRFIGKCQNKRLAFDLPITQVLIGNNVPAPFRTELMTICESEGLESKIINT